MTVTGTELESVASYTCAFGYTLEGSSSRVCELIMSKGEWSGIEPHCSQIGVITGSVAGALTLCCMIIAIVVIGILVLKKSRRNLQLQRYLKIYLLRCMHYDEYSDCMISTGCAYMQISYQEKNK